jgi:hypothetical protein
MFFSRLKVRWRWKTTWQSEQPVRSVAGEFNEFKPND